MIDRIPFVRQEIWFLRSDHRSFHFSLALDPSADKEFFSCTGFGLWSNHLYLSQNRMEYLFYQVFLSEALRY